MRSKYWSELTDGQKEEVRKYLNDFQTLQENMGKLGEKFEKDQEQLELDFEKGRNEIDEKMTEMSDKFSEKCSTDPYSFEDYTVDFVDHLVDTDERHKMDDAQAFYEENVIASD